jgi:prevent-host-death family protein
MRRSKRKPRSWQIQEAKARFSELVNEATKSGYQTITKNGEPIAVIMSKEEFETLLAPRDTLLEFFMKAPYPELDLSIERSLDTGRDVDL